MSGEIVLVPMLPAVAVPIAVVAGLSVGIVGVSMVIKGIVDKQVEAARREMEIEKTRILKWQFFQEEQRRQMISMQAIQQSIAESEKRLSAIQLTQGYIDCKGEGHTARGYTSAGKSKESREAAISLLNDIAQILISMPSEFINASDSPYQHLLKQEARLRKKAGLGIKEVESFKETIVRTLKSYMNSIELMGGQRTVFSQKVEAMLNDVLVCLHLTAEEKHISELNTIKANLLNIMNSKTILAGQVELLEKRFKGVKSEIEFKLTNTAFRSSLTESMTRNLTDMGYELIEEFPEDVAKPMLQAAMRIPGGERVRIAIQSNNKMSFQVCHESGKKESAMSEDELLYFRQQEKKWCQDLKELIRRLTAEGYAYKISLERLIPDMTIPIAVVETVDEILSQDEDEDMEKFDHEDRRRTMK